MKFPDWLPVVGDMTYRGECPREDAELITFFNELQRLRPDLYAVAIHPDNEGLVFGAGHLHHARQKAKGAVRKGAADIIIIGSPAFVCELKRRDHTLCRWQDGQLDFLQASLARGAFACVALGHDAAIEAVKKWSGAQ